MCTSLCYKKIYKYTSVLVYVYYSMYKVAVSFQARNAPPTTNQPGVCLQFHSDLPTQRMAYQIGIPYLLPGPSSEDQIQNFENPKNNRVCARGHVLFPFSGFIRSWCFSVTRPVSYYIFQINWFFWGGAPNNAISPLNIVATFFDSVGP